MVTPLLDLIAPDRQLRSARACGGRTAVAIGSWDHLSSKGRISELPDRVLVWNDTQYAKPPSSMEFCGAPRRHRRSSATTSGSVGCRRGRESSSAPC